jgi:threonine dehydrogenase-like Zn-dependent dehydrogenase
MENVPGIHRGFDVCIEAAGEEECMQMGIKLCKPNGTCKFWEQEKVEEIC